MLSLTLALAQGRAASPLPPIDIDSSEAPDLYQYCVRCQAVMGLWYPKILKALGQAPDPLQRRIVLRIRADHPKEISFLAYASGDTVTVFADFARASHPYDIGAIVHELTHVLQKYKSGPGWLVEGVADYVRYFVYEPRPRPATEDLRGRRYTEGYGTAAAFLAWTQERYDRGLVAKINADCKAGRYDDRITFRKYTGKDVDALWDEYVKARLEGH